MSIRHLCLTLMFIAGIMLPSQAQTISDEILQMFSPNAAELGKYGKIPVDYFNGLPTIEVPLTTLKAKGEELPVYLTYYAGGHNPEQHPGWVGLGWTLRAGGCISRIINNRKDEISHDEIWNERTKPTILSTGDLDTLSYFDYIEKGAAWAEDENAAKAHFKHNFNYGIWCDMEPDEFQINLGRIQASFYITGYNRETGQCSIKIQSRHPYDFSVKVFLSSTTGNHYDDRIKATLFQYISKIIITDSDGTRYTFGNDNGDLSSIEFSMSPTDYNCYGVASVSTWNLTKIEYPNNEVITFGYIKDGRPVVRTILRDGRSLGYKIGKDFGNYLLDTSLPSHNSNGIVNMGSWYDYYLKNSGSDLSRWDQAMHVKLMYISPSYPTYISTSVTKDSILFHISRSSELEDLGTGENPAAFNLFKLKPYGKIPNAEFQIEDILSENYYMRLDSISQGSKRFSFTYGNNTVERLSLSSVRTNSGKTDGGLYSFEYNANKLPDHYCSGRSDRWGFYGKRYDTIPLPYHEIYSRRAPDSTLMKAEILQKITYPTGGHTEYVFEPHTYSASVQRCDSSRIGFTVIDNERDSIAGGLRIKKIINRDGEKEETRYFDYSQNNRSSGILSGTPVFFLRRDYLGKATVGRDGKSWIGSVFWKSKGTEVTLDMSYWIGCENYLNQLSTTDGSHVTYSIVTESYPDGGRIEYEYSNHKEALDASNEGDIVSYSPENPDYILRRLYASHSLDRGLLSRKCCYDSENNLLEETRFNYNSSPDRFIDNIPICQIRSESFPNLIQGRNASRAMSYLWTAGSRIYTYFPYLKRKEVISYSQQEYGFPKKTILLLNYKYDNHRRLIETVTKESDGAETTERIIYSGSDNVRNSGVYKEMAEASVNMTGLPLEKIRYKDGKAIAAKLTTYKKITTNNSVNYVKKAEYSALLCEPSSSFLPYDGVTVRSHYGVPILKYSEYDGMCNPLEIIRDGSDLTSLVWGYEGAYPTALFQNSSRRKGKIVIYEPGLVSHNDDLRANTEHWFSYVFETSEEGYCDVYFDIPENVADFNFWVVIDNEVYYQPRTRTWTDNGDDPEHDSEVYVEFMKTLWLPDGSHKLTVTTLDPAVHPIPESDDEQEVDLCFSYSVSPQTSEEVIPDDQHPAAGWFWIGYQGMAEREVNGFIGDFYYENFENDRGNSTLGFHSDKGYVGNYYVCLEVDPERLYYIDYRVYKNGKWYYKKYRYYGPSHTIRENHATIDEIRVYPADGFATTASWFPNIGPRSVTETRGINLSYEYDGLGRLVLLKDNDLSPTARYSYHFRDDIDSTNYVRETVYTEKGAAKDRSVTEYFDGLGRPCQTVRKESTDDKPIYVANLFEYDDNGRLSRSWMDTPVNGDYGCNVEPDSLKGASILFYGNATAIESRPFSENVYDGSPLNRIKTVFNAGQEWYESGKGFRTDWITNSTDIDILKCLKLKVTEYSDTSFTINKSGYYPAGSLRVRKETDEDGNVAYLFSDLSERTILERRIASQEETADTYYVYDDFGDLRAVLPPMLSKEVQSSQSTRWDSDSESFHKWAFLYVYDSRHRCVAKKTPGAGWLITVYDKTGNAILSQDALQRKRDEWAFSIPDGLGRVCIQGFCKESSIFGENTSIDIFSNPLCEIPVRARRLRNSTGDSGTSIGYEIDGLSINCSDALIVNYYDEYSFIGEYGFPMDLEFDETLVSAGFGDQWPSSLGMCTGTMASTITSEGTDKNQSEYTVWFYDEYGHQVQSASQSRTGVHTKTASAFDFTGNNILSKEIVTTATIRDTVDRHNTYDIWGRIKEASTTLSTKDGMRNYNTIRYGYDRIGRLCGVVYGEDEAINESISYNVRGWLIEKQSEVFGMVLRYNSPVFESNPKWNGNISEWEWRFGDAGMRTYSFSYDTLGRMTDSRAYDGLSATSSNSFTERNISYNLNGNILTLDRYGESEAMPEEAMVFTYSGNHIESVAGGQAFGYDPNGNMTFDGRNGLSLTYNKLNLVGEIGDAHGTLAKYTYLANGTKVVAERPNGSGTLYKGSLVYSKDADGNLSLDQVLADGGHFAAERDSTGVVTGYRFFHHLTDHLGSVRAVVDGDTGFVIEANDYYPFGKRIPLPVTESVAVAGAVSVTEPVEVTADSNQDSVASTSSATAATSPNRRLFSGKESQSFLSASIPLLDFGARMYDPTTARWTAQDPLAEKYYAVSPYAYCSANPVNIVDPNGLAWKPLYYNGEYVGYEWISNDDAYENGQLKDGYYEQAIFFTATGTQGSFDKDYKYNIGTSTAFVYLADGSIMAYNASTYPADLDKFPTVPEGLYEAKVGKHKGSYDALRLSEIGTENFYANRIDLDNGNPAFSDGRTYAQGINIHKAGLNELTGKTNNGSYISQGCLLISRTEWNSFIGHFANKSQRNNIVSVSVSRSVSTPVRYLLPPPIHISIKR